MRKPKYISPSSLTSFYEDRDDFYIKYMSPNRRPRDPQTNYMAAGSAFDAYVKSYLHNCLYGKHPEYELETILASQVEPHNLDWARVAGKKIFEQYKVSGALSDLVIELQAAVGDVKFEMQVEARVPHEGCVNGIPFLGKPDLYFKTANDRMIVYDWKVNGWCGKSNVSPVKGYIVCRDGWVGKQSRSNNKSHKDSFMMVVDGFRINVAATLENYSEQWAQQLCIYGWVLGEPVGSDVIAGIDQLCSNGNEQVRVATHRGRISPEFQNQVYKKAQHMWECICSGHVFDDIPREASYYRCLSLDKDLEFKIEELA
jgi:hypothetical protein